MKLWEIILPTHDNAGGSYHAAHLSTVAWFRAAYGGFTAYKSAGSWVDAGVTYNDKSVTYRILCDDRPSLDALFDFFPDQLAIALFQVGTGDVISRK